VRAILTVGIPACGKSTYAATLGARGVLEVNRDALRRQIGGEPGVPRVEAAVTRLARRALAEAARSGRDVIVSDTNLTRRGRKDLVRYLRKLGYDRVEAHVLDVPLAECLARNAARPDRVPEPALRRMYDRFRLQPPWASDGFDAILDVEGVAGDGGV